MANVLNMDKQIMIIGALAEGSSIRSIERMTGVHRDTVMRLGVKVGQGCTRLMDASMRNLPCTRLEMDEIWGFVGKKEKHVTLEDSDGVGSVWTFCAIDADTKLVPAFKCGDRSKATANAFMQDVHRGWLIGCKSQQTASMPMWERLRTPSAGMSITLRSSRSTEPGITATIGGTAHPR